MIAGAGTSDRGIPPKGERVRPSLAVAFDPQRNSLNFLRLILATSVVVSHAFEIGGYGAVNGVNQTSFGQIAVYGFFGISGYLIAASAMRSSAGRYLWQRFLRIFPAFWVCLVVTAFAIGVIAWISRPPVHCGLYCYFHARNSPYSYVYRDVLLRMNQNSIAGTPAHGPAALVWNGPMWTLFFEFLCYLILLGLSLAGFLRNRVLLLVTACGVWLTAALITFVPSLNDQFDLFHNSDAMNLIKFAAVFLAGSALYAYRDRVPDSALLALGCGLAFVACLFVPTNGRVTQFFFTTSVLLAPLVAYPMIWLGAHLPFDRVGARNDYSYGIYIYGFPISQLLAIWGVARWGIFPYTTLAVLATMPMALASWWLVERHALKLKRIGLARRVPRSLRGEQLP